MDLSLEIDCQSAQDGPGRAFPPDDEARLVERARDDAEAFGQLYRRHYAALGRYLHARTGDVHATEDLLAETFLSAVQGIGRFRPRGVPFRHWLLRIATNALRRRHRDGRAVLPLSEARDVAAPDAGPGGGVDRRDEHARVHGWLARLSTEHAEVLVLHYVEDLSVAAAAAVLGVRAGTVKSRLSRAREALRAIACPEA